VREVRDPRFFPILCDSLSRATAEAEVAAGESSRRCPALEGPALAPHPGPEPKCAARRCLTAPLTLLDPAVAVRCLVLAPRSSLRDCGTAMMVPRMLLLLCFCLLAFPPPGTDIFFYATYLIQLFIVIN